MNCVAEKRRAGTEESDAEFGCKPPQRAPVRRQPVSDGVHRPATWAEVEDAAGGAQQQAETLGVPHDPAGGVEQW